MKRRGSITMEEELLERLDEARGLIPRGAWIGHKLKELSRDSGRQDG